jgi:putative peptidoglycan lipid II flippase
MLSRVTGLLREVAFATLFGAGMQYDAFVAAFRIPNLFRDLLAEGALSSAFVTTFSQQLARNGDDAAFRLSNRLTTVLAPIIVAITLIAMLLAPQIVDLIFPGFSQVEGKRELTALLSRIMAPFLLFVALAAKAMGVLNAKGRFGIPALASACFNLTSLGAGLAAGYLIGPRIGIEPIVGMAIGVAIGGLAQYLWQVPSMRGIGLRFRPDLALGDPALRHVLRLMGPAVVGAAAVQVNVVVNSVFASQITNAAGEVIDGPVAWLGYAFRFMQLPLGVFGVAIAAATLPAVSRSAAQGRMQDFRETLSRSLGLVFLLTLPAAAGLIVLSESIVGVVYQHGRFTAFDTQQTGLALSAYCLGLAGYAGVKVLTPAFYALADVRSPAIVAVLSIFVNYGLNWVAVRKLDMGHSGLALATAAVATVNFLVLFLAMRRRADGLQGRRIATGLLRISIATAVMSLAVWCSSAVIRGWAGDTFFGRSLDLAVSLPLGLAILYSTCRALRVDELELARDAVLGRFRRAAS